MDWKSILATIAPWLGAAIGGPLGSAAVQTACNALGLSEKTEDALKQALQGISPEQMMSMKKADQDFQARMQELGFSHVEKLVELSNKDTDSARNRQIQLKDSTVTILAYAIVAAWVGINMILFTQQVPHGSEQLVARLLGTLDAALMAVLYYYFGSSAGSRSKDDAINAIATQGGLPKS